MIWQIAVVVSVFAFVTSVLTVGFGMYLSTRRDIEQMVDVVGGLAGGLLWFVSAFGMSSLEVVESGVITSIPSDAVAVLFAVFGVFMIVVAFVGTAVLLNVTDLAGMQQDQPR